MDNPFNPYNLETANYTSNYTSIICQTVTGYNVPTTNCNTTK